MYGKMTVESLYLMLLVHDLCIKHLVLKFRIQDYSSLLMIILDDLRLYFIRNLQDFYTFVHLYIRVALAK